MVVLKTNLITGMPSSLSCRVLSDWIDLKSLGRLDSAYCDQETRACFLGVVQSDECPKQDSIRADQSNMLQWALLRNVTSTSLVYDGHPDSDLLFQYLSKHAQHVNHVTLLSENIDLEPCRHITTLRCTLSPQTCRLIGRNPGLQELTLTHGLNDSYCNLLDQIRLPNLTALTVLRGNSFGIPSYARCLLSVVKMATSLQKLTLGAIVGLDANMPDLPVWQSIAKHCCHLRSVYFENSSAKGAIPSSFVRLCPQLSTFSMTNDAAITDHGMFFTLSNRHQLRSLTLQDCNLLTDKTVHYIGLYCKHLEELYLRGVSMTQPALDALHDQLPHLKVYEAEVVTLDGPLPDDEYLYDSDL